MAFLNSARSFHLVYENTFIGEGKGGHNGERKEK